MKHKFKNYLKLGIFLFGVILLLTNCQKDDAISESIEEKEVLKKTHISLNDFKGKENVLQTLNNIKKTKNVLGKTVYDSINNFYINTDDIILIETEEYHWLTFSILRDSENSTLDNLILKYDLNSNSYIAYIVEYQLTNEEIHAIKNGDIVENIQEKQRLIPLDNFDYNLVFRGDCVQYIVDHVIDNGDGTITVTYLAVPCTGSGGGGNGNTQGDTSGDSSGNTSDTTGGTDDTNDSNTNTGIDSGAGTGYGQNTTNEYDTLPDDFNDAVVTSPNLDFSQLPHTKALSQLTKSAKVKEKISSLIPRVLTQGKEDGAQYDLTGTTPITYDEVLPYNTSYNTTSFPSLRDNTTLIVHMHPKYAILPDGTLAQLSPVFSDTDIDSFLADFTEQNNNTNFTSILVSEAGVFALRITNQERAAEVNIKLNKRRHKKYFAKTFKNQVLINSNTATNDEMIEKFNDFLNAIHFKNDPEGVSGMGISLFQATIDADNNITTWSEIE